MTSGGGQRWTRRGFLGVTGGVAAAGLLAGRGSAARLRVRMPETGGPRVFASRPDLRPPPVAVATPAAGTAAGLVLIAPFDITGTASSRYGPLIVDNLGQPVWFRPVPKHTAMDLRVQRYRGQHVLTWYEGDVLGGYGGDYLIVDGTYRELARIKASHGLHGDLHEFLITSRNTALISIYRSLQADLSSVGGPVNGEVVEGVVQELELPSGRVLFEWHSLDHVGLDESFFTTPTRAGNVDYFHLNSIGVDDDGDLLISARHTSAIYKVGRTTGEVAWRLGGKKSDFTVLPGAEFAYQHDVRRHSDGTLTMFDNASAALPVAGGPAPPPSRAIRLALDTGAMTAGLVASIQTQDPRIGWAMGNVQELPDGGTFVGWGTNGSFTEFAPDGTARFDARLDDGSVTYRAFRFPWVGRPAGRPSLALSRHAAGTLTVYVSWNGATEVARWQVQHGPSPGALRPLRTAARAGFETAIVIPRTSGYVSVTALDAAGRSLGASKAVHTSSAS